MFLLCSNPTAGPLSQTLTQPTDALWTLRCAHICEQLAEIGMKLVEEAAEKTSEAFKSGTPAEQKIQAFIFTRLSHAVRQAIALEARLRTGQVVRKTPAPRPQDAAPARPSGERAASERLDANFAHVGDDEIPSLLQDIGAELGVTLDIPGRAPPQWHQPTVPLAASQNIPAMHPTATGPP